MIRKLKTGEYRLYSRKVDPKTGKRRNLGTFGTRAAAEKHERAVQFFKRRWSGSGERVGERRDHLGRTEDRAAIAAEA
jgi:hypothetical protein